MTLAQAKQTDAGSVTVAFSDQPLELKSLHAIDPSGQIFDTSFSEWKTRDLRWTRAMFHFQPPNAGKRHR